VSFSRTFIIVVTTVAVPYNQEHQSKPEINLYSISTKHLAPTVCRHHTALLTTQRHLAPALDDDDDDGDDDDDDKTLSIQRVCDGAHRAAL